MSHHLAGTALYITAAMLAAPVVGAAAPDADPQGERQNTSIAETTIEFVYSGQIAHQGALINSVCEFSFRLFDSRQRGIQIGEAIIRHVDVADGLFSTPLAFDASAAEGRTCWLEVSVDGQTLQPRHLVGSLPRIEDRETKRTGTAKDDTSGSSVQIDAMDDAAESWSTADSRGSDAGLPAPSTGYGGLNLTERARQGSARALSDESSPDSLTGVFDAQGDVELGQVSTLWEENGRRIYYDRGNVGIGLPDPSYDLEVRTFGQRGISVRNSRENGTAIAVRGRTMSDEGQGLVGIASSPTGSTIGTLGRADSTDGIGVMGFASATSGTTFGVYGETRSATDGFAGYFRGGRNYFEGSVGIGTETPSEALEVNGVIFSSTGGVKYPDGYTQTIGFTGNLDWTDLLNVPAGFADDIDDNTTYTAGAGLDLTGTSFSLDQQGASSGEVLEWDGSAWTPATDDDTTYSAGAGLGLSGTTFSLAQQGASSGQVLKWSGAAWTPGSDNNTTYSAGAGLGLSGTTFSLAQQGASSGQVLKWSGAAWTPGSDNDTTYSAGAGLGLSGTTFSLAQQGASSGQVLKWSGAAWTPGSDNNTTYSAGAGLDLSGTTFSLDQQSASSGEVLEWDGSAWTPATDDDTTYSAGAGLALSGTTFSLDQQSASSGEVLEWDGSAWTPATDDDTTYSAGAGLDLSGTTFSLDQQGAATGEVLKWDGAAWSPATDDDTSYWSFDDPDLYFDTGLVAIGHDTPVDRLDVHTSTETAAITGWQTAVAGAVYGVRGITESNTGVAGYFMNNADAGNVIEAWTPGDIEFRVDYKGDVYADNNFNSGGADYAEWLPVLDPNEALEPGDVVGVLPGGFITHRTEGASHVMVISTNPALVGNHADAAMDERSGHQRVAFIGQTPVKVRGNVREGDVLVASGDADGTAIAVAPPFMTPRLMSRAVGIAWDSFHGPGTGRVNAAVGVNDFAITARIMETFSHELAVRESRLHEQADRIESLESRLRIIEQMLTAGGMVEETDP